MSQYPSPYQSPYHAGYMYQQMNPVVNGPARRAGILMGILGGLMILGGVCCVGVSNFDFSKLPQESRDQIQQVESQLSQTGITMTGVLIGMGASAGICGLILVILAIFVFRGGMGAVITGLVLTALVILLLGFFTVAGALGAGTSARPGAAVGMCVYLLPLVLFLVELVWLIQAAKRAPQIQAARAQQQAQMWQYQQTQQMYGQGGAYGYPQQPPPPPPPPQQLPPQSGDSSGGPRVT